MLITIHLYRDKQTYSYNWNLEIYISLFIYIISTLLL